MGEMDKWTPEMWGTLIVIALGALTNMVVAIIGAFQNRSLKKQLEAHDEDSRARGGEFAPPLARRTGENGRVKEEVRG